MGLNWGDGVRGPSVTPCPGWPSAVGAHAGIGASPSPSRRGTRVVMATGSRAPSRCHSCSSRPRRRCARGWPGPLPSPRCGSGSTRSPPGSARAARAGTHAACARGWHPQLGAGGYHTGPGTVLGRGHGAQDPPHATWVQARVPHTAPLLTGSAPSWQRECPGCSAVGRVRGHRCLCRARAMPYRATPCHAVPCCAVQRGLQLCAAANPPAERVKIAAGSGKWRSPPRPPPAGTGEEREPSPATGATARPWGRARRGRGVRGAGCCGAGASRWRGTLGGWGLWGWDIVGTGHHRDGALWGRGIVGTGWHRDGASWGQGGTGMEHRGDGAHRGRSVVGTGGHWGQRHGDRVTWGRGIMGTGHRGDGASWGQGDTGTPDRKVSVGGRGLCGGVGGAMGWAGLGRGWGSVGAGPPPRGVPHPGCPPPGARVTFSALREGGGSGGPSRCVCPPPLPGSPPAPPGLCTPTPPPPHPRTPRGCSPPGKGSAAPPELERGRAGGGRCSPGRRGGAASGNMRGNTRGSPGGGGGCGGLNPFPAGSPPQRQAWGTAEGKGDLGAAPSPNGAAWGDLGT